MKQQEKKAEKCNKKMRIFFVWCVCGWVGDFSREISQRKWEKEVWVEGLVR